MRWRLIGLVCATSLLSTLLFALPLALYARHVYLNEAGQVALSRAHLLASVLAECDSHDELGVFDRLHRDEQDGTEAAAFLPNKKVVGTQLPWSQPVENAFAGKRSMARVDGNEAAYVPAITSDGRRAAVAVVVNTTPQWQSIHRLWWAIGAAVILLPTTAGLLADRLGRAIVKPIGRLVEAAGRLSAGRLDTRVTPGGPDEVQKLGRAFNVMADRIADVITAERESAADVSHRLRTPVTALILQAESLSDPAESRRLLESTRQLQREISHIIEQARKPAGERLRLPSADLVAIVNERVDFWSPLAEEQDRSCTLHTTGETYQVDACPVELAAAVDVLIENVFTHTPEGVDMRLSVQPGCPSGAVLIVEDDGPGIANACAIRRGSSTRGSSGLGLDIVRRLAQSSGGSLKLGHRPGGGARIRVHLGPAADSPNKQR
jgi:signal transduction histidine kinase